MITFGIKRCMGILATLLCLIICCPSVSYGEEAASSMAVQDKTASSKISSITKTPAEADEAYRERNYSQALASYLLLADERGVSSELYYNIANCYYRLGQTGKAVLYYEKSLKLDPTNSDARQNLEFVKTTIQGAPESTRSLMGDTYESISRRLTADGWAWTAIAEFGLLLLLVAIYFISSRPGLRKISFFSGMVLLLVFALTVVITMQSASRTIGSRYAVVTAQVSKMSSSPDKKDKSETTYVMVPSGVKVEITDSLLTPKDEVSSKWYKVKLNDSSQAWAPAADVEKI